MAFDKVVDSAVLESGLTSIANAIREKAGTSDALAFPAGFAEAISAIQAGGGDLKYIEGSVTLTEDTTGSMPIAVDLSTLEAGGEKLSNTYQKCNAVMYLDTDISQATYDNGLKCGTWLVTSGNVFARCTVGYGWTGSAGKTSSTYGILLTTTGITLKFGSAAEYIGKAGYTYRYMIWRAYE